WGRRAARCRGAGSRCRPFTDKRYRLSVGSEPHHCVAPPENPNGSRNRRTNRHPVEFQTELSPHRQKGGAMIPESEWETFHIDRLVENGWEHLPGPEVAPGAADGRTEWDGL